MLNKIYFVLFPLLLLIACQSSAQKFLSLDRGIPFKRFRFQTFDEISVKLKGDNFLLKGSIDQISDNSFIIHGNILLPEQIRLIKFDRFKNGGHFLKQASYMFPIAGVALPVVAGLTTLISKEKVTVPQSTFIAAGVLVMLGPIAYRFGYHKIKINKRNSLKIVNVSINP